MNILIQFSDELIDQDFIMAYWACNTPRDLQYVLNIDYPRSTMTHVSSNEPYTADEMDTLLERITEASERVQDGLDIIYHDYESSYDNSGYTY